MAGAALCVTAFVLTNLMSSNMLEGGKYVARSFPMDALDCCMRYDHYVQYTEFLGVSRPEYVSKRVECDQ